MTYTAVNPHACCNGPLPKDAHAAHAAARPPPHPHAAPHLTNNDRLRWKTMMMPFFCSCRNNNQPTDPLGTFPRGFKKAHMMKL